MHEVAIAENIIEIVENSLNSIEYKKVQTLHLKVGPLSGVNPDALKFALESISENTLIEKAKITIDIPEIHGYCFNCDGEFDASDIRFICPMCGSTEVKITSGDELEIIDLEVE